MIAPEPIPVTLCVTKEVTLYGTPVQHEAPKGILAELIYHLVPCFCVRGNQWKLMKLQNSVDIKLGSGSNQRPDIKHTERTSLCRLLSIYYLCICFLKSSTIFIHLSYLHFVLYKCCKRNQCRVAFMRFTGLYLLYIVFRIMQRTVAQEQCNKTHKNT